MRTVRLAFILLILIAATFLVISKTSSDIPSPAEQVSTVEALTKQSQASRSAVPAIKRVRQERFSIQKMIVKRGDDDKKAGDVHSRLINRSFSIDGLTSGVSPDVLHLVFDNKAEIVGVAVSVDHSDQNVVLSEFSATINAELSGYVGNTKQDVLIHTSYSCAREITCPGKTDEHMWFGKNSGIVLRAGGWISFGAFQTNAGSSQSLTEPEFIIWYRWLE